VYSATNLLRVGRVRLEQVRWHRWIDEQFAQPATTFNRQLVRLFAMLLAQRRELGEARIQASRRQQFEVARRQSKRRGVRVGTDRGCQVFAVEKGERS
jgi:hypothetical protein